MFLGLASAVMMGSRGTAALSRLRKSEIMLPEPTPVLDLKEIPTGSCRLFHYPLSDDPCILIRLEPDRLVAFSQQCTHLSCPVYFQAATRQLICPCHQGRFSAEDGRPLAGPPQRPLTQFVVTVRGEQIWVQPSDDERV